MRLKFVLLQLDKKIEWVEIFSIRDFYQDFARGSNAAKNRTQVCQLWFPLH